MLSAGNRHDAPIGRQLLKSGCPKVGYLLMDKAYEDDETRKVAAGIADKVVVPPKSNRTEKWDYDEKAYENRNEVERFFGSIKENRRIATRYDKLDCTYLSFVLLACIKNAYRRNVNRP